MSNTVGLFPECHVEVGFGKNRLGNGETEIVDLPYRRDGYVDSDIVQPP